MKDVENSPIALGHCSKETCACINYIETSDWNNRTCENKSSFHRICNHLLYFIYPCSHLPFCSIPMQSLSPFPQWAPCTVLIIRSTTGQVFAMPRILRKVRRITKGDRNALKHGATRLRSGPADSLVAVHGVVQLREQLNCNAWGCMQSIHCFFALYKLMSIDQYRH